MNHTSILILIFITSLCVLMVIIIIDTLLFAAALHRNMKIFRLRLSPELHSVDANTKLTKDNYYNSQIDKKFDRKIEQIKNEDSASLAVFNLSNNPLIGCNDIIGDVANNANGRMSAQKTIHVLNNIFPRYIKCVFNLMWPWNI